MRRPTDVLSFAVAAADLMRANVRDFDDVPYHYWEVDVTFECGLAGSWWVVGSVRLPGGRVVVA